MIQNFKKNYLMKFQMNKQILLGSFFLVLFFALTSYILFDLPNLFFDEKNIGVKNILQNTNAILKYKNINFIVRSSLLIGIFLISFFISIQTLYFSKRKIKYSIVWISVYLFLAIAVFFLFIFLKNVTMKVNFYLSFLYLALYVLSIIKFLTFDKKEFKLIPFIRKEILLNKVSFIFRFILLSALYVLFALTVWNTNDGEKLFIDNSIVLMIDDLLSNINKFQNIAILFFIVLCFFFLIAGSYIHSILVIKNTFEKISNNKTTILLIFLIFISSLLAFISTFKTSFPIEDTLFGKEKNYLFMYFVIVTNLLTILFYAFLSKKIFVFKNSLLIFLQMFLYLLFIWFFSLFLILHNSYSKENFIIFFINLISSLMIIITYFLNTKKSYIWQNILLQFILIILAFSSIAINFNQYLINNDNYIGINFYDIEPMTIFILIIISSVVLVLISPFAYLAIKVLVFKIKRKNKKIKGVKNV